MPEMELDGCATAFEPGETVLAVARRVGVRIPTLCEDRRLPVSGGCRLCMVETPDGRLLASCTLPASSGLSVRTVTQRLRAYRADLLSLVLSEQPEGDCPGCAVSGRCALHRLADEVGARAGRFRGRTSGKAHADPNPLLGRDYAWCIACDRCTRTCGSIEQAHAIAAAGRGFDRRIAAAFDRGLLDSPCTFCGQCIESCPTGALSDRTRARIVPEESVRTICPYCGTGCGLRLDVAGGKILGVRGDPASPVSNGSTCVKGRYGWTFVASPDRLSRPLVREGGELREATWDEALGRVAGGLSRIRSESGPDSLVFFSSARATSEASYLFQKLARAAVGTNNIDNCART